MKAICMICQEVYAEVELETLRYPMTGAMFKSPDPTHGYPEPLHPSLGWVDFRCPIGRIHRPMEPDDIVLTDQGVVRLPKDGSPAYIDKNAKAEIDRASIMDRTVQVSDEEAEKQAREILQGGPKVITSDEVPPGTVLVVDPKNCRTVETILGPMTEPELNDKVESIVKKGRVPGDVLRAMAADLYLCPICNKGFPDERKMKGHLGGAHRKAKK